ncbi:unnamed protein product [Gadus morhua 'NCC']
MGKTDSGLVISLQHGFSNILPHRNSWCCHWSYRSGGRWSAPRSPQWPQQVRVRAQLLQLRLPPRAVIK